MLALDALRSEVNRFWGPPFKTTAMDFKDEKLVEKMRILGLSWADFEEQFVRGSGKGGQKINKTSSTVLLRHISTGLEVRVQKHREQSKNRLSAYRLLLTKIEDKKLGRASASAVKIQKLRKQKKRRARKNSNLSKEQGPLGEAPNIKHQISNKFEI